MSNIRFGGTPLFRIAFSSLLLSSLASCAGAPSEDPLELSVTWGLNGTSALPADVAEIEVITCVRDGQDETCDPTSCTIAALTLTRAAGAVDICRPEEGTEMFGSDPVLVRRGLAADRPLRFLLNGKDEVGNTIYTGQAGPFVLGEGERRFQRIQMYSVGASAPVPSVSLPRMLHTATYLPDGRVLVAGGFDSLTSLADCPEQITVPEGSNCFELGATDEAVVFDVATRRVVPVRAPMLAARGGHSATALPDGRVLLAGGAERAILAMIPQGAAAVSGYALALFPLDADAVTGAHDHYEIFDAFLGPEASDTDRDGDLGRGGFIGIAGTDEPGPLNHPRFLHAAAALASRPNQVLLAGGMGSDASSRTYEVFDARRAGGYGVYAGGGSLTASRRMPSAVSVQDTQVWIFGGGLAASEAELAEVWEIDESDPNGTIAAASEVGEFPHSSPAGTDAHPEYALFRPAVAAIDLGQRALVVGWYGAQCERQTDMEVFGSDTTEFCNAPANPRTRSFTVSAATGIAAPTLARPHAFGEVARVFPFQEDSAPDRVVVTGGIANRSWRSAQTMIDVFTGTVDASGAATPLSGASATLMSQRLMFHTSTAVPGFGLVTIGGVSFTNATLDRATLEESVEVLFLSL